MKIKTLSLSVILGLIGLMFIMNSEAAVPKSIVCKTAFGEKSFVIEDDKISFHREDHEGVSRSISSVDGHAVRTQTKHHGFSKTVYLNGNKHRISVGNINEFSDANDYLSITSPKGHEMTYPLTCHSVL